MNLEDELRRALAAQEPPSDFSVRMAEKLRAAKPGSAEKLRAARQPPGETRSGKHRIAVLALAASLALGTGGTLYFVHQRQLAAESERARSEQIRNEAVTGLRIASAKLNDVHERLLRLSTQNERMR